MAHTIEISKSGRASCRGCRQPIAKGDLRFGEETLNQFSSSGAMTHVWYHLPCAAKKKPSELKEALETFSGDVPDRAELEKTMAESKDKEKPAFPYAEKAPTGRSKCVSCNEPIEKGTLRIAIEREVDTGTFVTKGAGYLHPGCATDIVEDSELLDKIKANSRGLSEDELQTLADEL